MPNRKIVVFVILISTLFLISNVLAGTEDDFLTLINSERANLGKGALVLNSDLSEAAYLHAKDMAENNYFSHTSQDGTSFSTRIKNAGYQGYYALGENIAYHSGSPNADKVFGMWKNSPGHYSNMVSSNFVEMGLGVYSKNGYTYYVQDLGGRKITQIVNSNSTNSSVNNTNIISPNIPVNQNLENSEPSTFNLNLEKTETRSYFYFKVVGELSSKSSVKYTISDKTKRICSSCTKFRQSFRISKANLPEEGIAVYYQSTDKLGNVIDKKVILV